MTRFQPKVKRRLVDPLATVALAAAVLCWGLVPVLLRDLRHHVDAMTANGLRYPLSALLFLPFLVHGQRTGAVNRALLHRALAPAATTFCGQILWAMTPYYLEAPLMGFLTQSSVLWGLAGAMILFRDERALLREPAFHVGIVLALAGFLALSLSGGVLHAGGTRTGILLVLGTGFFFGLYPISVLRFMPKDPPLYAFGVVAQYVSIGALILMFGFGNWTAAGVMPAAAWLVMAASSILGIAAAHLFLYIAIQRIGAALSHGTFVVIPFVTSVLADIFLAESLPAAGWAAGTIMVAGAGLLLFCQTRIARRSM